METKSKNKTDFLVPKSSFITGCGSIISLGGWRHNYNRTIDPDKTAIEMDWKIIGEDLNNAVKEIAKKIEKTR